MIKELLIIGGLLFGYTPQSDFVYTKAEQDFTTYYPVLSFGGQGTLPSETRIADLSQDGNTYIVLEFDVTSTLYLIDGDNYYYLARYSYYNYTWTRNEYGEESDGYLGLINVQYLKTYSNFNTFFTQTPNDLVRLPSAYQYYISNVQGTGEYVTGFNNGFAAGVSQGSNDGYTNGVIDGKEQVLLNPNEYDLYTQQEVSTIRQEAYNQGFNVGNNNEFDFTLRGLISSLFMAPLIFVEKAFNFELFTGVSFSNIFKFIFTICLCVGVIKFLMGMRSNNE